MSISTRSPYWTKNEIILLKQGLEKHGQSWKELSALIPKKSAFQIQKYVLKEMKTDDIIDSDSSSSIPLSPIQASEVTLSDHKYVPNSERLNEWMALNIRQHTPVESHHSYMDFLTNVIDTVKKNQFNMGKKEDTLFQNELEFTDHQDPDWVAVYEFVASLFNNSVDHVELLKSMRSIDRFIIKLLVQTIAKNLEDISSSDLHNTLVQKYITMFEETKQNQIHHNIQTPNDDE